MDPDPEPAAAATNPASPPNPVRYEENIRAPRDGQLFLFVNDAVLAVPKLYGIFYGKNQGRAKVTITQQRTCFVCVDERKKPGGH